MRSIIRLAHREAELARDREKNATRGAELIAIAESCEWVPENTSRNPGEAVQVPYFCHLCAELEKVSCGYSEAYLGQNLEPYYQRDKAAGLITPEDATFMLQNLFLKLNEIGYYFGEKVALQNSADLGQSITLGGFTEDGEDATAEMDYLILDASGDLHLPQPALSCCLCALRRSSNRGSGSAFRGRCLASLNDCVEYRNLGKSMHPTGPGHLGMNDRGLLAVHDPERLRRGLTKMLDENEFLGSYGNRSISKFHEQHPYACTLHGQEYRMDYLPAESNTSMFGGNSTWSGSVRMPVNAVIIRALLQYYLYYGDNFRIECPTGSGRMMNLFEVSKELSDRLTWIFLLNEHGLRPVCGGTEKFQSDPHWRDHLQFFEYFHGDNGAGLEASHQTGWTGLVARFIHLYDSLHAKRGLEGGRMAGFQKVSGDR
jgi:hypothetical protein